MSGAGGTTPQQPRPGPAGAPTRPPAGGPAGAPTQPPVGGPAGQPSSQRRPETAVGAVIVDDDALLLVRRAHAPGAGLWSLPGGRVEWGETLAHAVVREVSEETGIDCVCGELVGWVERFGDDTHFVILDFWATPLSLADPVAGSDASEVRWVPLDEVTALPLVPGLAEFLGEHGVIELIS